MAEVETNLNQQSAESLALRPQIPMIVPKEVKELKLAGQLPRGDIGYFNVAEPDTIRLVDQLTWKPVTKKGVETRINIGHVARRFAGMIIHVPSRTPENSYEDRIVQLSELLRRTSEREEGIITHQNLGVLFIVEDKGEDLRIGWRQRQLTEAGLVVDKTHGGSVVISGDRVISYARRAMQRSAVDLRQGKRSGNMVGPFVDRIKRDAEREGYSADTSGLEEEASATRNPPRTISNLRDGGGVVYETTDPDGKRIVVDRSGNTETVSPSRDALQRLAPPGGREKSSNPEIKHKGGDIEQLETRCGDCGGHFQRVYYERSGRVRSLLFSKIVCADHPGGPATIEAGKYEGALGFLPPSMRKNTSFPTDFPPKDKSRTTG